MTEMLPRCWELHLGPFDGKEVFPDPVVPPPDHYIPERTFSRRADVYHQAGTMQDGHRVRVYYEWCPECSKLGRPVQSGGHEKGLSEGAC